MNMTIQHQKSSNILSMLCKGPPFAKVSSRLSLIKPRLQPQQPSNILARLPNELLAEVFARLDIFSLRTLLDVWPDIRKYFLIVMDTDKGQPLVPAFFNVPGIRTVCLEDYATSPNLSNVMITLFEFLNPDFWRRFGFFSFQFRLRRDYPILLRTNSFNKFSFIYLCYYDLDRKTTPALFAYMRQPSVRFRLGAIENLFCDYVMMREPREAYVSYQSFRAHLETFSMVKDLEITCISRLQNVNLPNVKEIILHYLSVRAKGKVPKLTNLKAPKVEQMTVYYRQCAPVITKADHIGSQNSMALVGPTLQADDTTKRTTFRFIKVDALDTGIKYSLPPCPTPLKLIRDKMDFSFTKNFQVHQITGGHDLLLFKLSLEKVTHLIWMKTNLQLTEHQHSSLKWLNSRRYRELSVPSLISFNFTTTVPNTMLPLMQDSHFQNLGLSIHSPNFNPNRIFENDFTKIATMYVDINNHDWKRGKYVTIPIRALAPTSSWLACQILSGCVVDPSIDRTRECLEPMLFWADSTIWRRMRGPYGALDSMPSTPLRLRNQFYFRDQQEELD